MTYRYRCTIELYITNASTGEVTCQLVSNSKSGQIIGRISRITMIRLGRILEHFIDDSIENDSIGRFKPHHRIFYNWKHGYAVEWWSRDHRKNRHPKVSPLKNHETPALVFVSRTETRLWGWEWWNISWWVVQFFFWGSVVWVVNGTLAMWPLENNRLQDTLSGWTAFTGGLIFIFGGYTAFLEVINQHKKIRLGHLLKVIEGPDKTVHHLKPLSVKQEISLLKHKVRIVRREWRFWGYIEKDWGWWLNTAQLIGAFVFFTACIASVPGILPDNVFLQNSIYWVPQIVGAVFFMIASWMAVREVQLTFFSFPVMKIGWQVGFWNLIGATGFFLCGFFGLVTNNPALINSQLHYWGASFSTFWGSIAFLLSSYLMLLEILNRHKKQKSVVGDKAT